MKKLISIIAIVFTIFSIQSFITSSEIAKEIPMAKKKETIKKAVDVKYVFCWAWQQAKSGGKNQPVVSNVFRFECDNRDYVILGEFHDYYDAYFKSSTYTGLQVKSDNKLMYDSLSEAEKARTQAIAKYRNNGNVPLLMDKFSSTCGD